MGQKATGRTLHIVHEFTTGLHLHDLPKLLEVVRVFRGLNRLFQDDARWLTNCGTRNWSDKG